MLELEQVKAAMPREAKSLVSQQTVDMLNALQGDEADLIRENWLSWTGVFRDGKVPMQRFTDAVKYVTLRQMGKSQVQAYRLVFPDRYAELIKKDYTEGNIASHVNAYHSGKLVQTLLSQSMIPLWLMHSDLVNKAIGRLGFLMMNAQSEKVQSDSAKALLEHLKRPEAAKIEIDVGVKNNSGLAALEEQMASLAAKQRELIQKGVVDVAIVGRTPLTLEHQAEN